MAIVFPDDDPATLARKAYEREHGVGSVKTKRTTSEEIRARHSKKPDLRAEEAFLKAWLDSPLVGAEVVREYQFHPQRRWRFDFAWPSQKVALEVEGWGRHQTFEGYKADCEKYNAALQMGWKVLRFMAADKRLAHDWVRMAKLVLCGIEEPELV
jgi:very-short-patch-repair endonuclease